MEKAEAPEDYYINVIMQEKIKLYLEYVENCLLYTSKNGAPIIGNNVYIGPGAILFGDITIADNVSIGANATVNRSFTESNVVIAGTPAEIVKRNVPAWNEV